jgi:hypothetical protein
MCIMNVRLLYIVQCVRLLERVSRALNMPAFAADVTVDEVTNEVIVRAEQLCQSEIQNDRKTLVIHLQRKVKKLKEKLIDKVETSLVFSSVVCCA